jgi:Ca2+:H+ antiporter
MHAPPVWVFFTACLGVLPLAGYMGEATSIWRTAPVRRSAACSTRPFGNAAELIIAIVALRAGLVELVKASITGSILGNLLLILGLAVIAGGTAKSELKFQPHQRGHELRACWRCPSSPSCFPRSFIAWHPEAAARVSELRMSEAVA